MKTNLKRITFSVLILSILLLISYTYVSSKNSVNETIHISRVHDSLKYFQASKLALPWTPSAWKKSYEICWSNKFDDVIVCLNNYNNLSAVVKQTIDIDLLKWKYVYWINKQWNFYSICKKPKNTLEKPTDCFDTPKWIWSNLTNQEKTILSYQ